MKIRKLQEEKEEDHQQGMNDSIEVGIDEVGKGCIFGPVFSSAVVLTLQNNYLLKKLGVNDSKKLSAKKKKLIIAKDIRIINRLGNRSKFRKRDR